MNNIKTDILSVEQFFVNRPDMASYDNNIVQSAIFQTSNFLNARCNGMISKVWYVTDTNSELFRNEDEKDFIKEAFISQTQYTLNMGNDFSVGSESLSIGGLSGSFQRPVERKEVAPGVDTLLQAGRVFFFQQFSLLDTSCRNTTSDGELNDYITYNLGDARYVAKNQPNANLGSVATIGEGNFVVFSDPKTIDFNTLNSQRIWDRFQNQYVDIHDVETLSFFGNNLSGFGSGVTRGEIYNLLAYATMNWRTDFQYKKDMVIQYAYQVETKWVVQDYLALRDNINANPITSPQDWQSLGALNVDINEIITLTFDRVVALYDPKFTQLSNEVKAMVPTEIDSALDKLPTVNIENIIYKKGLWYQFKDKSSFDLEKTKYNMVENVDYQTFITIFGSGGTLSTNFLGHSERSIFIKVLEGDIKIDTSHLPRGDFAIQTHGNIPNYGGIICQRPNTAAPIIETGYFPIVQGFSNQTNGAKPTNQSYSVKINTTNSQNIFIPAHYGCYMVLFLKDIIATQKAVVRQSTNIMWGAITGDITKQTDLIALTNNFVNGKSGNVEFTTPTIDNTLSIGKNVSSTSPAPLVIATKSGETGIADSVRLNTTGDLRVVSRGNFEFQTRDDFVVNAKTFTFTPRGTATFNLNNTVLKGIAAPIDTLDATNKLYVDTAITNLTKRTLVYNTILSTNETLGGKPVFQTLSQVGNIKSNNQIAGSGVLVNGIDLFLGVEYGVIRRNQGQIHNINAVNNLPDQHASIIYQDGNSIKWYFNPNMTLTSFKNMPFIAMIKFTQI